MYHYTDVDGHKAISSQPDWRFRAAKPPGPHPVGAYFTPLAPTSPNLCKKLMIPRRKIERALEFTGDLGLFPLDDGKGRGHHVLFSPVDYIVARSSGRQRFHGATADHPSGGSQE